jgi:hypothetical protein
MVIGAIIATTRFLSRFGVGLAAPCGAPAVRTPPVQPSDLSFRWIALSLKLRGEFLGLPWIDAAQAKLPTAMNLCKAVDR